MDQTKARERNHSLKITSGTYNPEQTVDEVGGFVMRNGVTGKEHNITLWASGIEEDGTIEEIALYMDDPEEIGRLTDDGMSVDGAASDALIDYTLNDLIKNEEELRPSIEKYAMDPAAEYEHAVSLENIDVDLHELIVNTEITDLIMKGERGALAKEDLLEFGQLVKGDAALYDVSGMLEQPIANALERQEIKPEEAELLRGAIKTLGVETDFSKEINFGNRSDSFSKNNKATLSIDEVELSR